MTQATESREVRQSDSALLVALQRSTESRELVQEHLDELDELCRTFGITTTRMMVCPVRKLTASTLVTSGKLEEIAAEKRAMQADVVIFDDEISPAQQRNLEEILDCPVMDRAEIILEVFAQRAHTKEAHIQVELAKARFSLPRLKRMWTHLSREAAGGSGAGGGAYLRGMGEKQIEVDRRIVNRQIKSLEKQLEHVVAHRNTLRASRKRKATPLFALVGYTNAGKSSLLNALSEADAFVEDQLFATLDTLTRRLTLPNNQDVLLIDTVGFIRKLPHLLVAAFRSTLEEALYADVLLHVVDSVHPAAVDHMRTTMRVLAELGAEDKPVITVLNKADLCDDSGIFKRLRVESPRSVVVSTVTGEGIENLLEVMVEELARMRQTLLLRIPQSDYGAVSYVQEHGKVMDLEFEGNDVLLRVELAINLRGRVEEYVEEERP